MSSSSISISFDCAAAKRGDEVAVVARRRDVEEEQAEKACACSFASRERRSKMKAVQKISSWLFCDDIYMDGWIFGSLTG